MFAIPKKVENRLTAGLKKFQSILNKGKTSDLNENDTVRIITDMLNEIFGYDKYSEITSEYAVKNSYCDLCVKMDNKVQFLLEAKAIGIDLKDNHIKQATDYAANLGVDWVVLSNGVHWRLYRVLFEKPITHELVIEIDMLGLNFKSLNDVAGLFILSKEGLVKSSLDKYHIQKQALSKYYIGAIILSPQMIELIKKEIKKISPEVKIETEQIKDVLLNGVLKREVLESEKYQEAQKIINKVHKKNSKPKTIKPIKAENEGSSEKEENQIPEEINLTQ